MTVYCRCDHCGEDISEEGYLMEDTAWLKPRRLLLCPKHATRLILVGDIYKVLMYWSNFVVDKHE